MSDKAAMPQADEKPSNPEYGRPASIEEFSNRYLVHPLSGIVAKFAIAFGVSANLVSFMGLGAGFLAAVFYYYQAHHVFVIAGFLAMVAWHVFDGADGRVARATGTSSAFGRIIDGMCDHLVFGSVYFAFVFYLLKTGSANTVWLLAIGAALSHAVQAAGYEERRQKFQRRSRGVDRSEVSANLLSVNGRRSILAGIYDGAQRLLSGTSVKLDDKIEALRASLNKQNAQTNKVDKSSIAEIQTTVNKTALIVRAWALLNANNRTIMIAVMAYIGRPELYFIYEIIVLNVVLIGLILFEHIAENRIADSLSKTGSQKSDKSTTA